MDNLDRTLVRMLQKDGRLSHEALAREVGLSRPAVHDRIRRLEAAGVIRGYAAQVDWDALGLPLTAFILARIAGSCFPAAQTIYRLGSERALVEECHRVAGDWCMLIVTRSASPLALQDLLDEIREVPGVQATMTTVALSTVLPDSTPIPAPEAARR